jgi:hypothetical protein
MARMNNRPSPRPNMSRNECSGSHPTPKPSLIALRCGEAAAGLVMAPAVASGVQEVPAPVAAPGEVVVNVARVGVCGTDMEFFTGDMAYLSRGTRHTRCGSG